MNDKLSETMKKRVYCPMTFNVEQGSECYETTQGDWYCAWWDESEKCCCVKSFVKMFQTMFKTKYKVEVK